LGRYVALPYQQAPRRVGVSVADVNQDILEPWHIKHMQHALVCGREFLCVSVVEPAHITDTDPVDTCRDAGLTGDLMLAIFIFEAVAVTYAVDLNF
jgi:hypothetical protein